MDCDVITWADFWTILKGKGDFLLIASPAYQTEKKHWKPITEKLTAIVPHHLPLLKDFGTKMFLQYAILIFSMQMDWIT